MMKGKGESKENLYKMTNNNNNDLKQRITNKPSRHRKTQSQVFFSGNYIDQLGIQNLNFNPPPIVPKDPVITKQIISFKDKQAQQPFNLISPTKLPFDLEDNNLNYSTDPNNGSVLIKSTEKKDPSSTTLEGLMPPRKSNSFVPLVNTLVFAKDKEATATESYLLALGLCNNDTKRTYNPTSSVIEEENTVMVTESGDFSNKKGLKKSIMLDSKEFITKNLNSLFDHQNEEMKLNKIAKTINDILLKKLEKENKHKKKIETNKRSLLSSFYSIGNEQKEQEEIGQGDIIIRTISHSNLNQYQGKLDNSNHSDIKQHQKKLDNSATPITMTNTTQLKVTPNKKHNSSLTLMANKYYTNNTTNQSNTHSNANNIKLSIPHSTKNYNNPLMKLNKKKLTPLEPDNTSSLKQTNFTNALTSLHSKTKQFLFNTTSNSNNSITMGTRSNSQSSKCNNKQRNISFNQTSGNVSPDSTQVQSSTIYNNISIGAVLTMLNYTKPYEQKDAMDKVNQGKKGCYLILCKPRDIFIGLFKYYNDKQKFAKVYGSESCQNSIHLETIQSLKVDAEGPNHCITNDIPFNTDKSIVVYKSRGELTGVNE